MEVDLRGGGAVSANVAMGYVIDSAGWDASFALLLGACVISIIMISFTWNSEVLRVPK